VIRRAPKKRRQSAAMVFIPLATAFLIIAGIAIYGVISPYNAKTPPAPGGRGALVWGDGIFANKAQLKAWLRIHGASYEEWVKTHPAALQLIKPKPKHRATLAKGQKKAPVKKVAEPTRVPSVAVSATTTSSHQSTGIWLVVGFGLLLGLLAATPSRLLWRAGVAVGTRERELRVAAIGAGAALLLGVIAATIVG